MRLNRHMLLVSPRGSLVFTRGRRCRQVGAGADLEVAQMERGQQVRTHVGGTWADV